MTPDDPALDRKVVALSEALHGAAIPYAFGGALALAYYAVPRATVDVDINVFVAPDQFDHVVAALAPLGVTASPKDRAAVARDGQTRLRWEATPVDLFFAYDEFHYHAATRIRRVPFGPDTIPILAPEDLLVCKTVFDRRKDWIDIEQMLLLTAGTLDLDDVRQRVRAIVGDDDDRAARFERAVADVLGAGQ
jgi:hypothetical protein